MTQTSYAILTKTGSTLLAQAVANGSALSLTKIAIGQGTTTPTGSETALYDLLTTKNIADYGVSDSDSSTFWFTCFIPADEGPYSISEIGLLSADGSLIAIGHMDPAISKPIPSSGQTIDMVLGLYLKIDTASSITVSVSNAESVSLSDMETLPWLPVQSITETAPPDSVTNGAVYYVPTGATGVWENLVGKLVQKTTAGWLAVSPVEGHGIGLPDGTIYQYVSGAYARISAKLAEIASEASTRALADQVISAQFLNYYTKTASDARYLALAGGTVGYLNSSGDIKIDQTKWLYTNTIKDNGAGAVSVNSPLYGASSSGFFDSVRSSGGQGWSGGTALGTYRWGAPFYIGPVGNKDWSVAKFLAGMQFGDILGSQNHNKSGLNVFLFASDGTRQNYYLSNSGQLSSDAMGEYAPKTWVSNSYLPLSGGGVSYLNVGPTSNSNYASIYIDGSGNATIDLDNSSGGNLNWMRLYPNGNLATKNGTMATLTDLINGTGLAHLKGNPGYWTNPGGWIEQRGTVGSGSGGTTYVQFPIAFPTACVDCNAHENNGGGNWVNGTPTVTAPKSPASNTQAIFYTLTWNGNTKAFEPASGVSLGWRASGF
ncbi:MAG: DUF2793 domain-containing protein [Acetobacter sp.]|nr:DUF2793 domain-containing protein [Acetobacter sp.]